MNSLFRQPVLTLGLVLAAWLGLCGTSAAQYSCGTLSSGHCYGVTLWQERPEYFGAYTDISYSGAASNAMCANINAGGANTIAFVTPANCGGGSFDWSHYSISSRTQWNITKDFYVGLEGYYGHLNTMAKGTLVNYTSNNAQPTGVRTLTDQDVFVYRMRVHRDLVP